MVGQAFRSAFIEINPPSLERAMKFARWLFNIAAIYGVITVAPLYLLERTINTQNPPSITHPMFFYGFAGVTLAWQLLFFAIAYQPARLRPVIPFAILEKLSFGIGALVIYRQGRLDHNDLYFAGVDLCLAVLFLLAWVRLPGQGNSRT
jgi:hypothetical protein